MLVEIPTPEDNSWSAWFRLYRSRIVTFVILVIIALALFFGFHWFSRVVGYKAWLIGTADSCLVRLDTLVGETYIIDCYNQYGDEGEIISPWKFQSGIADNKHGVFYASFKFKETVDSEDWRLGVASFNMYTGEKVDSWTLPSNYLNYTGILVSPEDDQHVHPSVLYGVLLYKTDDDEDVHQAIAKFEISSNASIEIIREWPEAPSPAQACCKEAVETVCFHQPALSYSHGQMYYFPQCNMLYEWDLQDGNTNHTRFSHTLAVLIYYERIDALIAISMLPIPGRPGTMQPDVAILKHNRLTQMNVLTRSLEYIRVPLDATIDFETQTLYILLGEPSPDGRTANNLRIYTVDISVGGVNNYRIVQRTDVNPSVVYPKDVMNMNFLKITQTDG